MRFLLDVHISTTTFRALVENHDVVRAAIHYPTWPDDRLLRLAAADGLVIVTQDSDFSDLIYAHSEAPPPAVIDIRCDPELQPMFADRILGILASGRLEGHMAVIKSSSIRYRPLPVPEDRNA